MTDPLPGVRTDPIPWPGLDRRGIRLFLRREDLLFPNLSGNKFRKLRYNLQAARSAGANTILTLGGAFSNHIHATAAAGAAFGFQTIGVIRGAELADAPLNPTLMDAQESGMRLVYISRQDYRRRDRPDFIDALHRRFGGFWFLPEGGTNARAILGCREILDPQDREYDLVCCPVGTGGTLAGLVEAGRAEVWGYAALQNAGDLPVLHGLKGKKPWKVRAGHHLGGYAKLTPGLLEFTIDFHAQTGIVLDGVYTAKMLMGIIQDARDGVIPEGSSILAIHTGGVQGNRGLNQKLKKKGLPLLPV